MKPEFKAVVSPDGMAAARNIRFKVFVHEQNVPEDLEMDAYDESAIHVLCVLGGNAVGTGRLVRMPDGIKMGRVAILPEHRGKGLGAGIVLWLLKRAKEFGAMVAYANVQEGAVGFYEKLGFKPVGAPFIEAGIYHIRMDRALD